MSGEVPITFVDAIYQGAKHRSDDGYYLRPDLPPGAGKWLPDQDGKECAALSFVCPCGCGRASAINVSLEGGRNSWQWDGDREKPTLKPSIQQLSACRWHGHLTAGIFKPC